MSRFVKKGLDVKGVPPGHGPSDFGITEMSGDPSKGPPKADTELTSEEAEQLGRVLKAALKAVDTGIGIGIKKDLSTSRGGVVDSFFSVLTQGISTVLYPGSAPRRLERNVRSEAGILDGVSSVNRGAKNAFQAYVIEVSKSLYNSNFSSFMEIVKSHKKFKNLKFDENDTSELQALAIEYKGADPMQTTMFSEKSPYKIIMNRLIPILREKFDAVVSFREEVGEGASIDYEGIGDSFSDGSEGADDIGQLEGLYKAIDEWYMFVTALSVSGTVRKTPGSDKDKEKEKEKEKGKEEGKDSSVSIRDVLKGLEIRGIRPGAGVSVNEAVGGLVVDRTMLSGSQTPPVVNIVLGGRMVKHVNEVGKSKDYFDHFISTRRIKLEIPVTRSSEYYVQLSRETVDGGAELTIFLNPVLIARAIGANSNPVNVMTVRTERGLRSVIADDTSMLDAITKLSGATSTTPLYEAVSPSGERVAFTPADIVLGGGSLKDSKGNKFKYKKRKGKSLADRVTSKDFGKVKRGLKKKR